MNVRKSILMSLLYIHSPVVGNDKLMNYLFRIQEKLDVVAFRFLDFDVGPVDFQVYAELNSLKEEDLIEISKGMNESGVIADKYQLTGKGHEIAKIEFEKADKKIKFIIASMK